MNGTTQERPDGRRTARLDEALAVACTLAGQDAIGSLHVVMNDRPTYDEILRYRRRAEACGFALTVTGTSVVLRPRAEPVPTPGSAVVIPSGARPAAWDWARRFGSAALIRAEVASANRLSPVGRRMRSHVRALGDDFRSMSEGTR